MSAPPPPRPVDDERLLEQAAWIRALARSLVADAHLAEDLAQDACVAALERPPADAGNLRGWLAAVVRNLHRQVVRSRARRSAREEGAAAPEAQAGTLDVLARAGLQRELYEAVMALSEPNRTAILLRFFDGLSQRRIAAQLGVPVATVHSRVQRGLSELRGRLAERHGGDQRAWVLALLPLAKQAVPRSLPWSSLEPGALAPLGALVMDVKVKVGIGVALAACGVLGLWPLIAEPEETPRAGAPSAASAAGAQVAAARPAAETPQQEALSPADVTPARRAGASAATVPSAPPAVEASQAAPIHVRGRVLDAQAFPLPGLRVAFRAGTEEHHLAGVAEAARLLATSDAQGVFELQLAAGQDLGELVAADPALVTLMSGKWRAGSIYEPVIVVAAACPLSGVVVDAEGAPVAEARLSLSLDPGFESRFAEVLDASKQETWRAQSDARGAFAFPRAPAVGGSVLATVAEGFRPDQRSLPGYADTALSIVLERPHLDDHVLEGIVLGPQGTAVEGARVVLGPSVVTTARDGLFALPLTDDPASLLRALKPGYLPAGLLAAPEPDEHGRLWPAFVTLQLGGPTLALSGRVVDEDGGALAGIRAWLADSTYLGVLDGVPTQVENLLAGSPSAAEIEREEDLSPELRGRDVPSLFWTWAQTDGEGRFRIEGLVERDYRLKAMDIQTLALVEDGPFRAGSDGVRLVLPTRDVRTVAGRVVTRSGKPLADVRVAVARTAMEVTYAGKYGTTRSSRGMPGTSTVTGEDGRFELDGVPPAGVFVTFVGDSILPDYRELAAGVDASALEVVVDVRCHFQVELDEPFARADRLAILDAGGEPMELSILRGDDEESGPTMPLSQGRSVVIAVGETAATLVLYRGREEVERYPIVLAEKTLNLLRF